VIKFRN